MAIELWGTDGKISMPTVPSLPILVDLGGSGFAFTAGGIAHNINGVELEELITPNFAPPLSSRTDN